MKVMQINCTYRAGSTGKIMYDIHTYLQTHGHDSVMCYGRGADTDDENVYRLCPDIYAKAQNLRSRFTGFMYGGCFLSTNKLISIIRHNKPDIVHLHCINGYFVNIYRLLKWLKKNGQKTVLTLHAEFMYTANCGHAYECDKWMKGCGNCPRRKEETLSYVFDGTASSWKRMAEAYRGFERDMVIVSVSPWLMSRAQQSPMLSSMEHTCIFNGLDTSIFKINDPSVGENKSERAVLFVTAYFSDKAGHPKGGYYLIELARRMPDVKFLVAGKHAECENLPDNVTLLGNVNDQSKLASLYESTDISVVLSKRETFSMPVAESLCCGTPVVGFCAGAPEQITIPEYSEFVEYGDVDSLERAVKEFLGRSFDRAEISEKAHGIYNSSAMVDAYLKVYRRLYENK